MLDRETIKRYGVQTVSKNGLREVTPREKELVESHLEALDKIKELQEKLINTQNQLIAAQNRLYHLQESTSL